MIYLRSRLFDLTLVLWTSLFAPPIPILWLCGSPETAIRSATRLWARGVLFTLRYTVGLDYSGHAGRSVSSLVKVAGGGPGAHRATIMGRHPQTFTKTGMEPMAQIDRISAK